MKIVLQIALGLIAAIGGFVDIGDLVFNTQAGATYGYSLLWRSSSASSESASMPRCAAAWRGHGPSGIRRDPRAARVRRRAGHARRQARSSTC